MTEKFDLYRCVSSVILVLLTIYTVIMFVGLHYYHYIGEEITNTDVIGLILLLGFTMIGFQLERLIK